MLQHRRLAASGHCRSAEQIDARQLAGESASHGKHALRHLERDEARRGETPSSMGACYPDMHEARKDLRGILRGGTVL